MNIGRVRGIPINLHWSFLLLAVVVVGGAFSQGGQAAALAALAYGGALFGSVALHELGHALAARAFGVRTRSITLYPFGGIAALEAEPRTPVAELVVAGAGPAVNGLLAALGALGLALGGPASLSVFVAMNLGLGVFNLIPAYPMDGGRVLRALLTPRMGRLRATLAALNLSRFVAWAFVGVGLIWSWNLALVGGFLLLVTGAERRRLVWLAERAELEARMRQLAAARWGPRPALWEHPVA